MNQKIIVSTQRSLFVLTLLMMVLTSISSAQQPGALLSRTSNPMDMGRNLSVIAVRAPIPPRGLQGDKTYVIKTRVEPSDSQRSWVYEFSHSGHFVIRLAARGNSSSMAFREFYVFPRKSSAPAQGQGSTVLSRVGLKCHTSHCNNGPFDPTIKLASLDDLQLSDDAQNSVANIQPTPELTGTLHLQFASNNVTTETLLNQGTSLHGDRHLILDVGSSNHDIPSSVRTGRSKLIDADGHECSVANSDFFNYVQQIDSHGRLVYQGNRSIYQPVFKFPNDGPALTTLLTRLSTTRCRNLHWQEVLTPSASR